jgi:SAM-dependent methyltransferase
METRIASAGTADARSSADERESFYDEFSAQLVRDVVHGNERVSRQRRLLASAIHPAARAILVVGFGSGEIARYVAEIVPAAQVTAVDISGRNLAMATALFAHPRVSYRKLDVTRERLEGEYDVIVFPDVYEHIPADARIELHAQLDRILSPRGRILLTLPSPAHQEALRRRGHGLQVVDETVTLEDVMALARDVHGAVTYFNSISVWHTNDYLHAIVERGAEEERTIEAADRIPLKGLAPPGRWHAAWRRVCDGSSLTRAVRSLRRRRMERRMRDAGGSR